MANALALPALVRSFAAPATELFCGYIGTYTRTPTEGASGSKGIYRFDFDAVNGTVRDIRLAYETVNPSYLAQNRDRSLLFAVNEIGFTADEVPGRMQELRREHDGLRLVRDKVAEGRMPCCIQLGPKEKAVFCTSYADGVLSAMRLDTNSAVTRITPPPSMNALHPQLHHVSIAPDSETLIVADFGADRILLYRLDDHDMPKALPAQTLILKKDRGPRSMDRLQSSPHLYVLNQKSSTVVHLAWDEKSRKLELRSERACVPMGLDRVNYPACIRISANGRFVYASNRGHDSIAVFSVLQDGELGEPAFSRAGGAYPRHFTFDPTGRWLLCANQYANKITIHSIDPVSGMLTLHAESASVSAPAFIMLK